MPTQGLGFDGVCDLLGHFVVNICLDECSPNFFDGSSNVDLCNVSFAFQCL